jgi:hypothetical protein
MPSMNVKPEYMEYLNKRADQLIKKAEQKGEKLTKGDAQDLALDILIRAGIHRQKASENYAKSHKPAPKPRKPKAAKKSAPKKAAAAPKKAKAPKATKKTEPKPAGTAAPEEKPTNGGAGLLE